MRIRLSDRIDRGDVLRPQAERIGDASYSEWLHFNFSDEGNGLHGIVNLAMSDTRDPERGRAGVSLVVCAEDGWHGTMNVHGPDEASFDAGSIGLEIGGSCVRFDGDRYIVSARLRDGSVAIEGSWTPLAAGIRVENIGSLVSTFVLPSLAVEGELWLDGRRYLLQGATGYHDHNWGHWSWGRDLGWDWGYLVQPRRPGEDRQLAVVFGQVTDASRVSARSDLVVMVWVDGQCAHVFLGDAVEVVFEGRLDPYEVPRIPAFVSMLGVGRRTAPQGVVVRAAEAHDRLEIGLRTERAMQFLIPTPDGRGATTVSELLGRYDVQGVLDGEAVAFSCPGFAELAG